MSKTLVTPEAILSFPCLLQARAMKNEDGSPAGKPKFSSTLVFVPGGDARYLAGKIDIAALKKAAMEAAQEKFGSKLAAMMKAGKFRSPFLSDAEEIEKRGYPEGAIYLRVTSLSKPTVVSCYKGPDGNPLRMSDEEVEEKLYPGARVRASVRAFAYDTAGNRGVAFALHNLQWLGEGERIDGRTRAEDEFEATADAADLDTGEEKDEEVEAPKAAKSAKKAAKPAKAELDEEEELSDLL